MILWILVFISCLNIENKGSLHLSKIQVSIDEANVASIRLFEHLGFKKDRQEEELIDYIYIL